MSEVRSRREYPERPIVGVGAVVVDAGKVLLVRRRYEPLKGRWSLPGGAVEVGEPLERAVAREILEETGLVIDVGPVIEVLDRITYDARQRVQYHYVLIDYLCHPVGGHLVPGSDVDAAIWADPAELAEYDLTEKTAAVIRQGLVTLAHGRAAHT